MPENSRNDPLVEFAETHSGSDLFASKVQIRGLLFSTKECAMFSVPSVVTGSDGDLPTIQRSAVYAAFNPSKKIGAEDQVISLAKVCLSETGAVTSARIVDESPSKVYNAEVRKHLASLKKLPPVVFDGTARRACEMIAIDHPLPANEGEIPSDVQHHGATKKHPSE